MVAEQSVSESNGHATCPECGEETLPGSDQCYSCGAAIDSGRRISLEMWEWGGGLIGAMGFFLTPVLTALPALYCAFRIYDRKPRSAYGILAVVFGTILFWIFVPLFILP